MSESTQLCRREFRDGFARGAQDYRESGASGEYPNTRDVMRYELLDKGETYRDRAAAHGSRGQDNFGLGYLSGVESAYWGTRSLRVRKLCPP